MRRKAADKEGGRQKEDREGVGRGINGTGGGAGDLELCLSMAAADEEEEEKRVWGGTIQQAQRSLA